MKKVLIINRLGIGDVVLTTPLAKLLKESFNAQVGMLVSQKAIDIIQNHPYIDDAFGYRSANKAELIKTIKRKDYTEALVVDERFTSSLLAWRSGCQVLNWGFEVSLGKRRIFARKPLATKAVEDYASYIKYIDPRATVKYTDPIIGNITSESRSQIDKWLQTHGFLEQKLILIVPRGVAGNKNWPIDFMAQINDYLNSKQVTPVYLGSKGDYDYIEQIKGQKINAAGTFSLREVAVLAQHAAFSIAPCTGAMHIIATARTPLIALYGPTNPMRWAPPHAIIFQEKLDCVPCERLTCSNESKKACMKAICPENLIECIETNQWLLQN